MYGNGRLVNLTTLTRKLFTSVKRFCFCLCLSVNRTTEEVTDFFRETGSRNNSTIKVEEWTGISVRYRPTTDRFCFSKIGTNMSINALTKSIKIDLWNFLFSQNRKKRFVFEYSPYPCTVVRTLQRKGYIFEFIPHGRAEMTPGQLVICHGSNRLTMMGCVSHCLWPIYPR